MDNPVKERIEKLRGMMRRNALAAFIIPSTDPHMSEYVAPHWQAREWFSGFNGSAGTLVVTPDEAGLWTDSRYFLQAAEQLEGSGIDLYKDGLPDTPSIEVFLQTHLRPGEAAGIEGQVFATSSACALQSALKTRSIRLQSIACPFREIWTDRPPLPEGKAFVHPMEYAGRSCHEKLADIRQRMEEAGAEALLLSALDEIAWTLNIRGNDIHCNPVVVSYLLIEKEKARFFIQPAKTDAELEAYLAANGIDIHPYEEVQTFLAQASYPALWLENAKTNYALSQVVPPTCRLIDMPSPVALLKAVRNEVEMAGL